GGADLRQPAGAQDPLQPARAGRGRAAVTGAGDAPRRAPWVGRSLLTVRPNGFHPVSVSDPLTQRSVPMRFLRPYRLARPVKPASPIHPRLEVLEDRCVPSALTVTKISDTGLFADGSLRGEILAATSGDSIQFAP